MNKQTTFLRPGRAWLLALCAIGCSSPSAQVLTGRVDTSQHAVAVRAIVGDTVVTASEVRSDGSFTLALPAGDRYRLEVLTSAGVKHLVTRDGSSVHGLTFKVCAPVAPFDIGNCGGPGGGGTTCDDPSDPSCKPPPCDPSDPTCPPPPPPCDDPTDPNCKPLPCDPTTDPACPPGGGGGGCDPADPSCAPCDPATDPNCKPPPCDPATDPACPPPPPGCDPGDPSCPPWPGCDPADPSCVPCDPTTDPYCKCDANGNCGGGGTGGGCTDPTEPGCAPPCSDPTDPEACKDELCMNDPMSCGCEAGAPDCWPQPSPCDANGTCEPGSSMTPDHPPGDFGCTELFPS